MTRYVFIKEKDKDNPFDNTRVTLEVEAGTLDDILESFKEFLLASGFSIKGEFVEVDYESDE